MASTAPQTRVIVLKLMGAGGLRKICDTGGSAAAAGPGRREGEGRTGRRFPAMGRPMAVGGLAAGGAAKRGDDDSASRDSASPDGDPATTDDRGTYAHCAHHGRL